MAVIREVYQDDGASVAGYFGVVADVTGEMAADVAGINIGVAIRTVLKDKGEGLLVGGIYQDLPLGQQVILP